MQFSYKEMYRAFHFKNDRRDGTNVPMRRLYIRHSKKSSCPKFWGIAELTRRRDELSCIRHVYLRANNCGSSFFLSSSLKAAVAKIASRDCVLIPDCRARKYRWIKKSMYRKMLGESDSDTKELF